MRRWLPLLAVALVATAQAETRSLVVVTPRSPWTLRELEAMHLDLVSYDPDSGETYLIVTPSEERLLVDSGYAVATVEADAEAGRQRLLGIPGLGLYHTYDETVAVLESLQSSYPTHCRLQFLGNSLEGRPIPALKISDTPEVEDASEPDVLFVGNHHAREFMSVEVPLHLARNLLARYAANARIRQLVDTREIWIVPLLNADGHVYQAETQLVPGWRKNRRTIEGVAVGVDLNRNYSYRWGYDDDGSSGEPLSENYRGTAPFSEPESEVLRRLVERQNFSVAVSYHSFGRLVLYPWGYTREFFTPDHAVFASMADSMVRENGYRPGNAATGAIYLTNGVWDDYMYGDTSPDKPGRTFAFTVELNSSSEGGFWPPEDLIEPTCMAMWPLNLYVLRVADDVRSTLPPSPPLLTAIQDATDGRRIHLAWGAPRPGMVPVDHYEVFEVAPVQDTRAPAASSLRLGPGDRGMLASSVRVPGDGALPVRVRGQLDPRWESLHLLARVYGEDTWHELPWLAATRVGRPPALDPAARLRQVAAAPWAGRVVDLALHLEADAAGPQRAWVEAKVDVAALLAETRRVIAVVYDTVYTVTAERAGLFAYGVTAVDAQGQRADSDIHWFVIPEGVAVHLRDLAFSHGDGEAMLRWRLDTTTAEVYEAWVRPLSTGAALGNTAAEWARGAYRRVAAVLVTGAGSWSLRFAVPPGRTAVLLRTADGTRLWGPWVAGVAARVALHPATPNPFNPQTRLRFECDGDGPVTLEITRADGKRVRRLVAAATLRAGTYDAVWDGRDDDGRAAAAGVYYVALGVHGERRTTRLVLLP